MTGQVRENIGPLQDTCEGSVAWIVGTGTSLDDIDVGQLEGQFIIALNAAYELFLDRKKYPDAWWLFWDIRAYTELWNRIGPKVNRVQAFLHKRALESLRSLRCNGRYVEFSSTAFKSDRTVIETALLIVDFLGFDEAYMAGVDFAVKEHQPYAQSFSWKQCHFWDASKRGTKSKSCRDMLTAFKKVHARLKKTKIFHTSPLFPEEGVIPYLSFDEAVERAEAHGDG